MKILKPTCPACHKTISFLEVRKAFNCPHCGSALTSSGQGKVLAFEIAAFLILGWFLAAAVIYEHYIVAALVLAIWLIAEYFVRNVSLTLEPAGSGQMRK
jgi:ribosomal protein S27E